MLQVAMLRKRLPLNFHPAALESGLFVRLQCGSISADSIAFGAAVGNSLTHHVIAVLGASVNRRSIG
jgi:hypothetical protein